MTAIILFWIVLGGLGFGLALAIQMRILTALVLARALKAWRTGLAPHMLANMAVRAAASRVDPVGDPLHIEAVEHLRATYPQPLSHLQTARRACWLLPAGILLWLALGRFIFGVMA